MDPCGRDRTELTELLRGDLPPERGDELRTHVEACEACAAELRELRAAWSRLGDPALAEVEPPAFVREAVLGRARSAVASPRPLWAELRVRARQFAAPVVLGVVASGLIVAALEVRGLLAVEGAWPTAALSLALGGLLAVLAGAARRTPVRAVRSVLVASAAAFGGYVALTVALPIPETVEFCRVRLLAAPELSMSSLCLIYLTIAVLYAGLPAGLAAYVWSDRDWPWAGVLAEAALFVLLAVPVLALHFGTAELLLGLSALVGLAAGALSGGAAGRWVRRRRLSGTLA